MYFKKHSPKRTFLLILSLLIFNLSAVGGFFTANATVRYVSHSGSNTPPYTSWATAADSIMSAINISLFGDTIYVANGIYEEQILMIPGLSLIGAGMDSCVIDTRYLIHPFNSVEIPDSCVFKNFKIIVSNGEGGVGFSNGSNWGIFEENKVQNGYVGGNLWSSSMIVRKNIFSNQLHRGLDIMEFSGTHHPFIEDNYFIGAGTSYFGVLVGIVTKVTINNNTIYLNGNFAKGYSGGGSDSVWIYNNVIIAEDSYDHADGLSISRVPTFVYNNLVMGDIEKGISCRDFNIIKNNLVLNTKEGIKYIDGSSQCVVQHNNAWNNDINYFGFSPDSTNISVDPMIMNDDTTQGELDFHLQMFSLLIDAGDPNILDVDSSRSDIGLYGGPFGGSYAYQDLAPRPPVNLTAKVDSNKITVSWNRNTDADFSYYSLFRDTIANFNADSTTCIFSLIDTFYTHIIPSGVEAFYYKLTATDNQGNQSLPSDELAVLLTSIKSYPITVNSYKLFQNYPNPFNPSTKIGYRLKERGYVKLYVYNIQGELIELLVNQYQEAGYYEVEFYGEGKVEMLTVKNPFASGFYICQIIVQNEKGIPIFSDMKKMILLK